MTQLGKALGVKREENGAGSDQLAQGAIRETLLRVFGTGIRSGFTGVCFALLCANSLAAVDICDRPVVDSQVSFGFSTGDKAQLDNGLGDVEQEDYKLDSLYSFENAWSVGIGYRYKILRFDPIEPQTNGHLHTLFVPIHRQSQSGGKDFRFSIAPALSASSNVMKDPSQYDTDALQLLAALVWRSPLSESTGLRYGICGDHRFGSYKIYPVVSYDWQFDRDWSVELGFPMAEVRYQVTSSIGTSLRLAPNGNEWYVKDKSLQFDSQFVYESYLLNWNFNWQVYKGLIVNADIGWQFENQYELTLLDGSRVKVSSDPFMRVGAAVGWRF